jgi:hypothetical protein
MANVSIPTSTNKTFDHSYTSETHDRDSANLHLAKETSGLFLGMMLPQQFFKRFLTIGQYTPQHPNWKGGFESISSANKEVDIYSIHKQGSLFLHPLHFTNI